MWHFKLAIDLPFSGCYNTNFEVVKSLRGFIIHKLTEQGIMANVTFDHIPLSRPAFLTHFKCVRKLSVQYN